MKKLELQNFGVQELDAKEMVNVDGGIWGFLFGGIAAGIVISAIDNFGDIREGISDARNGKKPRYQW